MANREGFQSDRDNFVGYANAPAPSSVMAGLVPAIHVFLAVSIKTRMPGTSPGMTASKDEL
jgi:hypothetical protein